MLLIEGGGREEVELITAMTSHAIVMWYAGVVVGPVGVSRRDKGGLVGGEGRATDVFCLRCSR